MHTRALVWFRADLRVDDHPALAEACRAADRGVVGVFVICPRQWRSHDWADIKVEFLLRNLACLSERLKRLRIPLLIRSVPTFERVPAVLRDVARQFNCDALYFNREYEVNERRRDEAVTSALTGAGLDVRAFDDRTIVAPGALHTRQGGDYTVFTPFKRAWTAHIEAHGLDAPRPAPRPRARLVCAPDSIPEQIAGFDLSRGRPDLWPAGERVAQRRLSDFLSGPVTTYRKLRDRPAAEGTSRLSPYLTLGVLSPRRCLAEARDANDGRLDTGRAGPVTWINELIWREFYQHVLVAFPRVSMGRAFQPPTERLPWRTADADFAAWCAGRTGVPIVDAGLRQLAATGWMHNRLRMIVATYLAKDLLIDWRRGEQHFMRHLVDGDLASNNGGWQWAASTGTDAVPYFRIFNPYTQARKFDPDGEFIREWVPELRDVAMRALHDPAGLTEQRAALDYPAPLCDHTAARQRAIEVFKAVLRRAD